MTGDIEKYGTGFVRIRQWLRDYPEASYTIEEIGDFFKVAMVQVPDKHRTSNGQVTDKFTLIEFAAMSVR